MHHLSEIWKDLAEEPGSKPVVAVDSPEDALRVANTGLDPGTWSIKWLRGKADLIDGLQYNGAERLLDHFEYGE